MNEDIEHLAKVVWQAIADSDEVAYCGFMEPLTEWDDGGEDLRTITPYGMTYDGEINLELVVRRLLEAIQWRQALAMERQAVTERAEYDRLKAKFEASNPPDVPEQGR